MQPKTVSQSRSVQTQIVFFGQANSAQRLFGGELMGWMDVIGGVAARRHAASEVVTASIDRIDFLNSAKVGDTVVLEASLSYVGRTSMEVCVIAQVEDLSGTRRPICRGYFLFVAVNWEGKPTPVPPLIAETDEEKAAQQEAEQRWKKRRG